MLDAKAKNQGHKRKCSKKKKGLKNFFSGVVQKEKKKTKSKCLQKTGDLKKKRLEKFFSGDLQNFNNSKILLSLSRGQGNFRGLEALRPRPRTSKCVLEDVLEAKDVLKDSISVKNACSNFFRKCYVTSVGTNECIYCNFK